MKFNPLSALQVVRESTELNWKERLVLAMLISRANAQGKAWPSFNTMAKDCDVGRSTVIRAVRDLEARGWLACDRRKVANRNDVTVYDLRLVVSGRHQGGVRETPPQTPEVVSEGHQGGVRETWGVVSERHGGGVRETPKLSKELSIELSREDLGDEQSRRAAQPAPSDAELVWSELSQGTKRKLTPQRESAIAQALKQLGTVDAVLSYLAAARAKTGKDWPAALTSGEPSRIFAPWALELFATDRKLPSSPKAERPDPPEVRQAFTEVTTCYVETFKRVRRAAPAFGGDEGRAVKHLLRTLGVSRDAEGATKRARAIIANAFAHEFHRANVTIQAIARDPSKFVGRTGVPRVQQHFGDTNPEQWLLRGAG